VATSAIKRPTASSLDQSDSVHRFAAGFSIGLTLRPQQAQNLRDPVRNAEIALGSPQTLFPQPPAARPPAARQTCPTAQNLQDGPMAYLFPLPGAGRAQAQAVPYCRLSAK